MEVIPLKRPDVNTHQQLSFFTAEKSDTRVRATTISSVNFTIVSFASWRRYVTKNRRIVRTRNSTDNSRCEIVYITANFLSNAPILTDGHDASLSTNREVGCKLQMLSLILLLYSCSCAQRCAQRCAQLIVSTIEHA